MVIPRSRIRITQRETQTGQQIKNDVPLVFMQ